MKNISQILVATIMIMSSCKLDIEGCTDSNALNFNPDSTIENNSCVYDADGDGIYDADEIIGCNDTNSCNYNIDATDEGLCEYPDIGFDCDGFILLNIGEELQGGILFYIDETNQHGLVVGKSDLGEYMWGCYNTIIPGADGIEIGTGLQNTLDIIYGCSDSPIAASVALDYEYEGYTDWYLPSIEELEEICMTVGQGSEIGNTGNFSDDWYWSSSEDEIPEAAYCFHFIYEAVGGNHREGLIKVRPIHAF